MGNKKIIFRNHNFNKIIRINQISVLILLTVIILFVPGQNIYTTDPTILISDRNQLIAVPEVHPYPVNRTGVLPGEEISATGIVIRDTDSGAFLYTRNENELLAPASTTKILTALVALEIYKPDDIVTVRSPANDGQTMGLVEGERITVENLLYGTLIHSGNDAAYALADFYPGGVGGFVEKMNQKARELGLTRSIFTNPVGYDDANHKMTPLDLARLASAAENNRTIAKMVAIPAITISDVTHTHFHSLKNVNQLLGKIPGVGGIKTGWTEEAGENLVTLVERNGHRIILVVLKSKDRFGETSKLIEWVFANFEWQDYSPAVK
jgi:D-alanyl-D-alanine carboxypeptidase (penicillin-binding protein 5/6)